MVSKTMGLPTAASWWKERTKIFKTFATTQKKSVKAKTKIAKLTTKKGMKAKPKRVVKAKPKKAAKAKPKKVAKKSARAKPKKIVKSKKATKSRR